MSDPPKQRFHQRRQQFFQQEDKCWPRQQNPFDLSSLLHRINALESSLHHFSISPDDRCAAPCSLRDVAARVIQTHFRAFLVRRSRTLRQLKELAVVKSSFTSLKSSVSNKTHFDFEAVSRKAMELLLKLDSIPGGDPMIRDGKRSISRDLIRFLEFIDGLASKRHHLLYKAAKNVRYVDNSGNKSRVLGTNYDGGRREIIEKLRGRVEKIRGFSWVSRNEDGEEDAEIEGFHQVMSDDEENPRISISGKSGLAKNGNRVPVKGHGGPSGVKKSVSFAENENMYRVFCNASSGDDNSTNSINGSDLSDDHGEMLENQCSEVEVMGVLAKESENDEEPQKGGGGSPQSSDEERSHWRNLSTLSRRSEMKGEFQVQNGGLVFSAPLPVKMETRTDLKKQRKAVKIIT